jgi:hypothetical protein
VPGAGAGIMEGAAAVRARRGLSTRCCVPSLSPLPLTNLARAKSAALPKEPGSAGDIRCSRERRFIQAQVLDAPDFAPFNGDPQTLYRLVTNPGRVHVLAPGEPFTVVRLRDP